VLLRSRVEKGAVNTGIPKEEGMPLSSCLLNRSELVISSMNIQESSQIWV
jgi:hypothetical protein